MTKVGICGCFAEGVRDHGGQPVKTRLLFSELKKKYGSDSIKKVDTFDWKNNKLKLLIGCMNLLLHCEHIIILPAANGVRVLVPFFSIFNEIFKRKLHYVVIGGWLSKIISAHQSLLYHLRKYRAIYVETNMMVKQLEKQGLNNVACMPNMKPLNRLQKLQYYTNKSELKLCTFSRVTKQKGIEDAIKVVLQVNKEGFNCSLDIYGQVDDEYKKALDSLLSTVPDKVRYKGIVDPLESVEILRDYYMQLFPTLSSNEGIPGSIIDSYFAGLPVLAARWDSFYEVILENITGRGFELGNIEDFLEQLRWCLMNRESVNAMRENCLTRSILYTPETAMDILIKHIKE